MAAQPQDIVARFHPGFGDQQNVGRHQGREPFGHREIGGQRLQIAVVDADDRRPERQCARQFGLVMHFDDRVHRQPPRFGHHRRSLAVAKHRHHHQHRVGACRPRFGHLGGVDDEILGEDRPVEALPHLPQVAQRTTEILAVGEHADRVGDRRIGARRSADRHRAAMTRRRSALDLHDEPRAGPRQRRTQAARGRIGSDRAGQARGDFVAFARHNAGQDVSHCSPRHRRRAPRPPCPTAGRGARVPRPGEGRRRDWRSSAARRR